MINSLKNMIMNEHGVRKKVTFEYYRDNELWYKTECGFNFPVPTSDTGNIVFNKEDKAFLFMRWIRKHIETINAAKNDVANDRNIYLKDISDYLKGCHNGNKNSCRSRRSLYPIRSANS